MPFKTQSTVDAILHNDADGLRKMNLKFNDILSTVLKVPFLLTYLVLIIVLVAVVIIGAIEAYFHRVFNHFEITGRLNCHVGLSNLQNCEWLTEFILQRAKNDHSNRGSC